MKRPPHRQMLYGPYDDVKKEGTRYSKEFAAFLKDVYGEESYDLPVA